MSYLQHRDFPDRRSIRSAMDLINDPDQLNRLALDIYIGTHADGWAGASEHKATCILGQPAITFSMWDYCGFSRSHRRIPVHVITMPFVTQEMIPRIVCHRPDWHCIYAVAVSNPPPLELVHYAHTNHDLRIVHLRDATTGGDV